jgi:predicted transcriptional regulator
MKQEFLDFINALMNANPDITEKLMTDNIREYLNILNDMKPSAELTDGGKQILRFLQENKDIKLWKAKDISEAIGTPSKGVSGSMRKLVNDGFCEKLGQNPVIYSLTEKGKNYSIID